MPTLQATFKVFSPRWGHDDTYSLSLDSDALTISKDPNFKATCSLAENGDCEWAGYGSPRSNPLMNIFRNDSIYAPIIVPQALEWAFKRFRDGMVEEETLLKALGELFSWIDQTAKNRPKEDFWQGAF